MLKNTLQQALRVIGSLLCLSLSTVGFCEQQNPETETTPTALPETPVQVVETEELRFGALVKALDTDSQAHWLNGQEENFLAIYRPATGASEQGAIVIVADAGQHPDWPGPVRYLRNSLPHHGWATLTLALPYQSSKAPQTQSTPPQLEANAQLTFRLQSAITHIQSLGLYNIVIVALGNAAPLTALSLGKLPSASYAGFIALAPWSLNEQTQAAIAEAYTDLPAGVLELVPALWPEEGLIKRKGLAKKKQHSNYLQVRLLGDIKHFRNSPQLLPRIRGWLKRNAEAMEGRLQRPEDSN